MLEIFIQVTIILFDDYGGLGVEMQAAKHESFEFKNKKEVLTLPIDQAVTV